MDKILIIDDDEWNRQIMKETLKKEEARSKHTISTKPTKKANNNGFITEKMIEEIVAIGNRIE